MWSKFKQGNADFWLEGIREDCVVCKAKSDSTNQKSGLTTVICSTELNNESLSFFFSKIGAMFALFTLESSLFKINLF